MSGRPLPPTKMFGNTVPNLYERYTRHWKCFQVVTFRADLTYSYESHAHDHTHQGGPGRLRDPWSGIGVRVIRLEIGNPSTQADSLGLLL